MKYLLVSLMCINLLLGYTKIKILKVYGDTAIVNKGNLINGQSGAIIHKFKDDNEIILNYAYVIDSNEKTSTIKFTKFKVLPQNALANTNLTPKKDDIFILNHLYYNSFIIAPNFQSYKEVKSLYKNFNFLNPDYFAAFLKIDKNPTPSKEEIQKFCISNQIGTLFFVIKNKIYLIDVISFKIIHSIPINISEKGIKLPFYSNVDKIENSIFSWSEIKDYNKYYSKMIGLKKWLKKCIYKI